MFTNMITLIPICMYKDSEEPTHFIGIQTDFQSLIKL